MQGIYFPSKYVLRVDLGTLAHFTQMQVYLMYLLDFIAEEMRAYREKNDGITMDDLKTAQSIISREIQRMSSFIVSTQVSI